SIPIRIRKEDLPSEISVRLIACVAGEHRCRILGSVRYACPAHEADRFVFVADATDVADFAAHDSKAVGSKKFPVQFQPVACGYAATHRCLCSRVASQPFVLEDDAFRLFAGDTLDSRSPERRQLWLGFKFPPDLSYVSLIALGRVCFETLPGNVMRLSEVHCAASAANFCAYSLKSLEIFVNNLMTYFRKFFSALVFAGSATACWSIA